MRAQANLTSHVIELNGVRIAYSETGGGPLALYAHGLTASRAADAARSPADFSAVGSVRRFVAYDARGHGESSGVAVAEHYSWAVLAGDMLALADALSPAAPIAAIGLSMGTGTLLHAALEQPERFTHLVLTAPPTAWQTRAAQVSVYANQAVLAETSAPAAFAERYAQAPVAPIFRDLPAHSRTPDIPHALLPSVFRGAGLSDLPAPERLRTLQHPCLILAWASDPGHPVSCAQALHRLLPNSQLHISHTSRQVREWGARAAEFLRA